MKNRKALAYHEAGHAVASLTLGVAVKKATVQAGNGFAGRVTHHRTLPRDWAALSPVQETQFYRHLTVVLAGDAAQRRIAPRSVRRHQGETDRQSALRLITAVVSSDRLADALYA